MAGARRRPGSTLTSTSRMMYAYSRDGGLRTEGGPKWPEKGTFNIDAFSKPYVVITIILAITGFFPPNEKVFQYTVILIVVLLAFWSRQTAIIAVVLAVFGLLLDYVPVPQGSIATVFIPGATTVYIAIGIAVIGAVITYICGGESRRFEGVPEGDKIAEWQKMIADIEKQYGEQ